MRFFFIRNIALCVLFKAANEKCENSGPKERSKQIEANKNKAEALWQQ